MKHPRGAITDLLADASKGDQAAMQKLIPLVYDELHACATHHMRGERAGHSLQPTALIHEVYLRLVDRKQAAWKDRSQFLAIASRTMRQVLVDHARKRNALARGGAHERVSLAEEPHNDPSAAVDVEELDAALSQLETLDRRLSDVVVLRYFGGMTFEEVARALRVSVRTVKRDWNVARLFLLDALSGDVPES